MQTTSAGDMNGDGFADLIVQWGYSITRRRPSCASSSAAPSIANTPDLSIPGPYVNYYTLRIRDASATSTATGSKTSPSPL